MIERPSDLERRLRAMLTQRAAPVRSQLSGPDLRARAAHRGPAVRRYAPPVAAAAAVAGIAIGLAVAGSGGPAHPAGPGDRPGSSSVPVTSISHPPPRPSSTAVNRPSGGPARSPIIAPTRNPPRVPIASSSTVPGAPRSSGLPGAPRAARTRS